MDRAVRPAADTGEFVVVEGYFDCLSLQRVGLTNTVATLGTALTPEHASVLRRRLGQDGRTVLCYDADPAGRRAAITGARVLLESGVDVTVLVLPSGTDPDDIVRERGADAFRELLNQPLSVLDFLLDELPDNPEERRKKGLELAPFVCSASDPAVRENLVQELARRLYIRPREIEERGRPKRRGQTSGRSESRGQTAPGERHLARILLDCSPEWRARIVHRVQPDLIIDANVRALLEAARELTAATDSDDRDPAREILRLCSEESTAEFVAELVNSNWPPLTDDSIREQLRIVLERQNRELSRRLAPEITAAEKRGDHEEVGRLLAEKARIGQNSAEN